MQCLAYKTTWFSKNLCYYFFTSNAKHTPTQNGTHSMLPYMLTYTISIPIPEATATDVIITSVTGRCRDVHPHYDHVSMGTTAIPVSVVACLSLLQEVLSFTEHIVYKASTICQDDLSTFGRKRRWEKGKASPLHKHTAQVLAHACYRERGGGGMCISRPVLLLVVSFLSI